VEHKAPFPVHLTLRARAGLPSLRGEGVFGPVREAIRAASWEAFRVVQFSVQRDHVHLIVEADEAGLGSGARGLAIRLARAINRALGRRGAVWGGPLSGAGAADAAGGAARAGLRVDELSQASTVGPVRD
jgi:hypothetical protein